MYLRALSKYKPPGAYIRRGDLKEGFLRYEFEGLIFGGAYTWRAYFRNFTVYRYLKKEEKKVIYNTNQDDDDDRGTKHRWHDRVFLDEKQG